MTDIDKSRREFDAWWNAGNHNGNAWEAWLAARASTPPAAAEPDDTYWNDKRKLPAPVVQAVGEPVAQFLDKYEAAVQRAMDGNVEQIGKIATMHADLCAIGRMREVLKWMPTGAAPAIQPPPSAEPAPFAYVTADHKMLIFADNVEGVTDDPASLEPLFRGRATDGGEG